MQVLRCPVSSCSVQTFRSEAGLHIHMSKMHPNRNDFGSSMEHALPQRKKASHLLTVPRSLHGTGARLAVDRLTNHLFYTDETEFDEAAYQKVYDEVVPHELNLHMSQQSMLDSTEQDSVFNDLCSSFLRLSRAAADGPCDKLLQVLKNSVDHLGLFLANIQSMKDIRQYFRQRQIRRMKDQGFQKKILQTSSGLRYAVYTTDAIEVLRTQMSNTRKEEIVVEPYNCETVTHPMNAQIGTLACRAAQRYIEQSDDIEVIWNTKQRDGEQSFIAALQLFSDKSAMSLSAGAVQFYPLHVTLLNYTEECRRRHITHGRTIVAYLPVVFDSVSDSGDRATNSNSRVDILRALHEAVENALNPLSSTALKGFSCCTSDQVRVRLHSIIAAYIADMPEAEDMCSVKRGVQTEFPCHRCFVRRTEMNKFGISTMRTLKKTNDLILRLRQRRDGPFMQKFRDLSMFSCPPVLSTFPMVGINRVVDSYATFRVEPMHVFHLGLSKLLKECAFSMLKDEDRVTNSMLYASGQPKPFRIIRRFTLSLLNQFLREVQRSSPGYGLKVDFSRGDFGGKLSGLFTDTGVMGMLEATDYESVDMVSPFLGEIIDRCCGLEQTADVTLTFTRYVDIVRSVYRWGIRPGWTETDLSKLAEDIRKFMSQACSTFSKYQPSSMGTSKFHALSHLVDDIRQTGGAEYLSGALFEQSHKLVKDDYSLTSRRTMNAMEETLRKGEERQLCSISMKIGDQISARNEVRSKSAKEDTAYLVKNAKATCLHELEVCQKQMYLAKKKRSFESQFDVPRHILDLCSALGEDGITRLIVLLRERLSEMGVSSVAALHTKLELPASAYVSGHPTPTLKNRRFLTSVMLRNSTFRTSERVVAHPRFSSRKAGRHDSVMIESSDAAEEENNDGEELSVWFGKALTFIRVIFDDEDILPCHQHSHRRCQLCHPSWTEELCFVQYFEVIDDDLLRCDEIDYALNCLRLRWHRTEGEPGKFTASKEFGLIPVSSLRGLVHVVRADMHIPALSSHVERRKQYDMLRKGETNWSSHIFYLNRFYRRNGDVYDAEDIGNDAAPCSK